MGTSEVHPIGTTEEAGLPNITGEIYGLSNADVGGSSGAFGITIHEQKSLSDGNSYRNRIKTINIDASRSSSIYGSSNTVQPATLYVNIWERIP